MPNTTYADRLRLIRISRNMSQQQLAKLAKLHWQTIASYEQGRRSPMLDTAYRIAVALDIELDYFVEPMT